MINTFWIGEECAADYGIIMREAPKMVIPERKIESREVPGRNGAVLVDKGFYKNVAITYKCALIPPAGVEFRAAAERVAEFLMPTAGYQKLTDTYDTLHFREAVVDGGFSVESIVEQVGRFDVTFDCKPQRWLIEGTARQKLAGAATLKNPSGCEAKPIFKVFGNGSGTLYVGNRQCKILKLDGWITIDCETEFAHKDGENKNSAVSIDIFPSLGKGETGIRWDGGITGIEIEPRWWTL